jgi:hypothetical protein
VTRDDWVPEPRFRELAHRRDGGVEVKLLWSALDNRLTVRVTAAQSGETFVLDAEGANALEVFYHPYAHADAKAAA